MEAGTAILAAAEVVDVTLVKARVTAFAAAHRAYSEAQHVVETAETQLRAGQSQVAVRDTAQDAALEELARALVAGGQPRNNPFAAFDTAAPSAVKVMAPGDAAKVIRKLAAAVQADPTAGKPARRAAQLADEAAQAVEGDLVPLDKFQATLRTARDAREATQESWDAALRALKRGVRAAADDGAPNLYKALFGTAGRSRKKVTTPPPPPATPPAPAATVA
jgi:hypothetical protein